MQSCGVGQLRLSPAAPLPASLLCDLWDAARCWMRYSGMTFPLWLQAQCRGAMIHNRKGKLG